MNPHEDKIGGALIKVIELCVEVYMSHQFSFKLKEKVI